MAERDAYLRQLRNELLRQRDEAIGERNKLLGQRDEAIRERNELFRQRDVAIGERNEILRQRDAWIEVFNELERQIDLAIETATSRPRGGYGASARSFIRSPMRRPSRMKNSPRRRRFCVTSGRVQS